MVIVPFLVLTRPDGSADLSATSLTHDGHAYDGPVFEVPPDVADELAARAVFRHATSDELATVTAKPVKPVKAAAKRAPRSNG